MSVSYEPPPDEAEVGHVTTTLGHVTTTLGHVTTTLDHVTTTRKRYYNTTYNSRHGKRRNFQASSYIKQLEDAARQKELEIEARIRAYEADARMISERALESTVMDERAEPSYFRTRKNMTNRREFVEVASRRTSKFRGSVRSIRCLNEAISAMRTRANTTRAVHARMEESSRNSPTRANSLPTTSSRSTLDSTPGWRKQRKQKSRIPPMPMQVESQPRKRTSTLTKFPSLPVTFRCLQHTEDPARPISYSDFLLNNVTDQRPGAPAPSKSAPAGIREIVRYETVQERTMRVRRIMGNTT